MHASVTQPSRSASSRRWHHASADSDVGISHCVGLIRQNKSKNADPDPQKTDSSLAPLQTRNLELRRKGESVSSKGVLVTQRTRRRMESRQRPSRRALHATHRASGQLSMTMKTRGCLRGQSASVGTTVPAENPTPRTHATVPMHGRSIGMARRTLMAARTHVQLDSCALSYRQTMSFHVSPNTLPNLCSCSWRMVGRTPLPFGSDTSGLSAFPITNTLEMRVANVFPASSSM